MSGICFCFEIALKRGSQNFLFMYTERFIEKNERKNLTCDR